MMLPARAASLYHFFAWRVLAHAVAFVVEETYVVAGGFIRLSGGAGVPFVGFGVVSGQTEAFIV